MSTESTWIGYAQRIAQAVSDAAFAKWCKTETGKKWIAKPARKKGSPYSAGYDMPEGLHELVEATGKGEEERAKALIMLLRDRWKV